jgi:hypothetical protein
MAGKRKRPAHSMPPQPAGAMRNPHTTALLSADLRLGARGALGRMRRCCRPSGTSTTEPAGGPVNESSGGQTSYLGWGQLPADMDLIFSSCGRPGMDHETIPRQRSEGSPPFLYRRPEGVGRQDRSCVSAPAGRRRGRAPRPSRCPSAGRSWASGQRTRLGPCPRRPTPRDIDRARVSRSGADGVSSPALDTVSASVNGRRTIFSQLSALPMSQTAGAVSSMG